MLYRYPNGLKSRNFRKAHLWSLSSLHAKFQFLCSIWRGDKKETVPFQGQKIGKPSRLAQEQTIFVILDFSAPPFLNLGQIEF